MIVPHTTIEQLNNSVRAIDAWLPTIVSDYVHAVGTCRMGRWDDPAAVVDLDCAVRGYEALKVVDASVMPDLPKCNTHLTTVAIAERFVAQRSGPPARSGTDRASLRCGLAELLSHPLSHPSATRQRTSWTTRTPTR